MKKIKLLVPIATVSVLAGTACTLASCACKAENKVIPDDMLLIQDVTLKGLKDGADISSYDELDVPSGVRIVDTDAFNKEKTDYSKIKTLKVSRTVEEIREKAFAGLTNLETIDFSEFTLDDIYKLTLQNNIFNIKKYCFVKLPEGLPDSVLALLKSKISAAGLDESSFTKPTQGNITFKDDKKEVEYDGIDPSKQQAQLTKWVKETNTIDVQIEKTGGTSEVDVKLIGQPVYEKNNLSYNVELQPQQGYTLKNGDYNEYKLTVIQKTTKETSNETTTDWVEIINNCKVSYKKPEIFVTGIEAKLVNTEKIYHQNDVITKDDIIVEAINNDRSRFVLPYGIDGYSVEGVDFETGYTFTEQEARDKTKTFNIKYSKKGVGEFSYSFVLTNLALKVETITVKGAGSITRGTNTTYSTELAPQGAETTINWSVEPYESGKSIEGIEIDNTGKVTVANQAQVNPINIVAKDATDSSVIGKKTNVQIEIPAVSGITFTQTYSNPFRGKDGWTQTSSELKNYTFTAKVDDPAAKQEIDYLITTDFTGKSKDESVTVNKKTGVVEIGKNVEYNKAVTIRAIAAGESPRLDPKNYADFTFNVDIPSPTKINIENTGTSVMQRVQETRTFTFDVEPEGAEQSVNWFAVSKAGKAITGLNIDANGELSATNAVDAQDINVYAKHKPIVKTTTKACTSDNTVVSITYPEITGITISGGPTTTMYRGTKASEAYSATIEPEGGYGKDIRWSVEEAKTGDGTSITKTGVLTIGPQVSYPNKTVTITAKAYDENGNLKATNSTTLQYEIPPIQSITIDVQRDPSPMSALAANTLDQGASLVYTVKSVTPAGADMDVNFTFDKGTTEGVTFKESTEEGEINRKCTVTASSNATTGDEIKYNLKIVTVGKTSTSESITNEYSVNIIQPKFNNASIQKINDVATAFEESAQDAAAAEAACLSFSDIKYIGGAATVRESLFNFVNRGKLKIGNSYVYVADVCLNQIVGKSKYALFTFIGANDIVASWSQNSKTTENANTCLQDSGLYTNVLKKHDIYNTLNELGMFRWVTRWDRNNKNFEVFIPQIWEYLYEYKFRSYAKFKIFDFGGTATQNLQWFKSAAKDPKEYRNYTGTMTQESQDQSWYIRFTDASYVGDTGIGGKGEYAFNICFCI